MAQCYRNKCPLELCEEHNASPLNAFGPFGKIWWNATSSHVSVCVRACAGVFGTAIFSPLGSVVELGILGISMPAE